MALSNSGRQAIHRERKKAQGVDESERKIANLRHTLKKYIDRLSETGLFAIAPMLYWALHDNEEAAKKRIELKSLSFFEDASTVGIELDDYLKELDKELSTPDFLIATLEETLSEIDGFDMDLNRHIEADAEEEE
jgi:hypothetical protein